MTAPTPTELLDVAVAAARRGGQVLRERLELVRTVEFKGTGRGNLVTDADHASEEAVVSTLRSHYPEHAVVAEEAGASGHSEWTWFVDPLDGTTNYAHAVPHFCVTLAVEGPAPTGSGRALLAGVVYDPTRDELFAAAKGQGATLNGRPLKVSQTDKLADALMCTGFPYDVQVNPDVPLGLFSRIVRQARGIRRMGSAALDLAYVAAGRFDGFFEFGLHPWDIAAAAVLVEEAGGVIRRVDGAPFDVRNGDVLAASASLAPALQATCSEFLQHMKWVPSVRNR